MKTCFKCQRELPLSDFYAHPQTKDGHSGECKECAKNAAKALRQTKKTTSPDWILKERKRHRLCKARKTLNEGKAPKGKVETVKKWQASNPLKRAAHVIVRQALETKRLERKPCEICGSKLSEAHHEDYQQPLNVTWLCRNHHAERHVAIREQSLRESFAS